ncbi:calcium-binding protein [Yoonia sp. R2-816]|uniref:calcium-binding protein n=1 Tax=Yoonia sp. R2-816 TaxID=3342638 RepID=UPI0037274910
MGTLETLLQEVADANAEDRILSLDFFENAARTLDATLPEGSTGTLSSGLDPINHSGMNGEAVLARDFIADISNDTRAASGSARVTSIVDTEIGEFLSKPSVVRAFTNYAASIGLDEEDALTEMNRADNQSIWGIASERYAQNLSGDIVAVIPTATPDRIFAKVELEEALSSDSNVKTINGIDRTTLSQMPLEDAFEAVKAASTNASVGLINKGLLDGTIKKSTYYQFVESILPAGEDISTHTGVFSQADIDGYNPPSSGSYGDFPLLKIGALGVVLEGVRQLGPLGDVLAFASTGVQAQALEEAGDYEAAAKLWTEFWFETSGGVILGGVGAAAGLNTGPWTAIGLGLLGSVAGSFGGKALGGWLYDQNPEWFEPLVGGRLDINKITTEQFVPVVNGSSNGTESFVNWIYSQDADVWIGISPAANEPLLAEPGSEAYAELNGYRDARIAHNAALDIRYDGTPLTFEIFDLSDPDFDFFTWLNQHVVTWVYQQLTSASEFASTEVIWKEAMDILFDGPPRDPLVLDLDGDGVELTSLETSNAYFDLDGDGFAENTGWVGPDDGLLVLDRNGNGDIDGIEELFGSPTESAFSELADLDSNGDGLINEQDAQFADLQVWRDLDQDGVSDAGELHSLGEAGIESISLETTDVSRWVNGNEIVSKSTVTHSDGSTSEAAEVLLDLDQAESVFELPDDFAFDAEGFKIPWLPGFGEIAPTPVAYTQNPDLKAEAESLIELVREQGMGVFQPAFDDFLVNWAGVEDTKWLSEASFSVRITYLYDEDKKLAPGFDALSAPPTPDFYIFDIIDDEQFDYGDVTDIAEQNGMVRADADYFPAFTLNTILMVGGTAQEGGINQLSIPPSVTANMTEEEKISLYNQAAAVVEGGKIKTLHDGLLEPFEIRSNRATQDTDDQYVPELSAEKFAVMQKFMGREYTSAENSVSHHKIIVSVPEPDLVPNFMEQYDALKVYYETRFLVQAVQSIILSEGEDADLGYLAPFEHIGYDMFNDVFFGDGAKFAVEFVSQYVDQGTDVVQNALEDLKKFQAEFGYLPAVLAEASLPVTEAQLEAVFGVSLEVGTNAADTISADGDTILVGGAGDDTLQNIGGSNVFFGGLGNDTLKGGRGEDVYVYRFGDGNDTIEDSSSQTDESDRLVFTDQNAGDLAFLRHGGYDLVVTASNGDTVTVTDHFLKYRSNMELIEFADGTVLDLQGIAQKSVEDQDGDGDDLVLGTNGDETFLGGLGNDTLKGGAGEDTYHYSLGDGNDTIDDYDSYFAREDRLVFTDQDANDVSFSRNAGGDLVVTVSNGDTVTVTDHFLNTSADMELIEFADGTVLDLQGIAQKSVEDQDGDGDDLVLGTNGDDTFLGGLGNDTLKGGAGEDTYRYSLGDGNDTIDDYSYSSTESDRLVFTDQNTSDVSFLRNAGGDLVVTVSNGDTVTVTDHFLNTSADMELIEFADGTVLDLQGIAQKSVEDQNGNGDDLVLGSSGDDTFLGGLGNDTLKGGAGADTYRYSLGDGNDTIDDYDSHYAREDRLVFTDQNAGDLAFLRLGGDDLVIAVSTGDTVTVTDHFRNLYADMELIEFADGTVLDLQGIAQKSVEDQDGDGDDLVLGSNGDDTFLGGLGNDTLKGGAGEDTYHYSLGDGNDTIGDLSLGNTESDRLVFTDQNASDVSFSRNAGGDLLVTVSNGDMVTVTDHFRNLYADMELIEFADGTVLDLQGTAQKSIEDQNGDGDDLVLGSIGDDTFLGGLGNDTLKGGAGADTYRYSLGDGNDTIDDYSYSSTESDRLVFTDLNAGDLAFLRHGGDDLVVTVSNGDTVTVTDHFRNLYADMELIEFADSMVLDLEGIAQKSVEDQNGNGDDLVLGRSGDDTFIGGLANDTLQGGARADTYRYSLGDGNDTIDDWRNSSTESDRLVFTDQDANDVSFTRNAGDDLVIAVSTGDTVTVTDHFLNTRSDMEIIEFADGTVLDLQGIAQKSIEDQNGDGDDLVLGSNGDDTFLGGVGNDTLKGGRGEDTYRYSLGDGNDTIDDLSNSSTESDRLVFTDQDANDVSFTRNAGDDLVVTVSTGDTVTVTDHFLNTRSDMELIEFADGTVLDLQGIAQKSVEDQDGDGDDLVLGSNGDDTFHGGAGNDTLKGGRGEDTYRYSLGDGNDTIDDFSYSSTESDRLMFTDQDASDVSFTRNAGDDLVIAVSTGDTVTVTDHFLNTRSDMELIEFADGTVLDLEGIREKSLIGGSGNDIIIGFSSDDVIDGGAGNDVLTGGGGADEFVFNAQVASGTDQITDFELNLDKLKMVGITFSALTFVDTGSGTRLEWNNGSVELEEIAVASLTGDQFSFF